MFLCPSDSEPPSTGRGGVLCPRHPAAGTGCPESLCRAQGSCRNGVWFHQLPWETVQPLSSQQGVCVSRAAAEPDDPGPRPPCTQSLRLSRLRFPIRRCTWSLAVVFLYRLELIFVSTFHSLVTRKVIIIYFKMRDVLVLNRLLRTRLQISVVFQSFCRP